MCVRGGSYLVPSLGVGWAIDARHFERLDRIAKNRPRGYQMQERRDEPTVRIHR